MVVSAPRRIQVIAVPLLAVACVATEGEEPQEELVDEAHNASEVGNGAIANELYLNGIGRNGIGRNGLIPGELGLRALDPSKLTPKAFAAIRDPGSNGALARDLLRYLVSCALRPDQTFSFSWTDSAGVVHNETYRGDLAMADWWVYQPLSDDYQKRWMSACIAARTNYYGVSVTISVRGSHAKMGSTAAERARYTVREGAFWGNLFDPNPYLRACYSPSGVAQARAKKRECAAGHLVHDPVTGAPSVETCGPIQIAGSCEDLCTLSVDSAGKPLYYSRCRDGSSYTDRLITTFLRP